MTLGTLGSLSLQAVLPDDLARACGIDITDARRLVSHVHRHGRLPERAPATIRRVALEAARAAGHVPFIERVERRASAVDPFVKYAFRLADGAVIESVRIPLERPGRYSACVSSQVGCALACAFCATGRMGLSRNLETWEIIEQVRHIRADLEGEGRAARVHGVLFQGMGEPLANADRVIQAIRVLAEPSAQAIDMRNITVCTAGLPSGIRKLLSEVPAVRIGISIGSVRPGRRGALMPIEGAHPLDEVLAAAGEHARVTGRSPMWAYTLLADRNDEDEDAAALADLALRFGATYGVMPRLSLIPYNPIDEAPAANAAEGAAGAAGAASAAGAGVFATFDRSTRLDAFREVLLARGVGAIVRYSGGGDVGAACGQLSREQLTPLIRRRAAPAPL